jgi:SAM-dependent methyltransferase
MKYKMEEYYQHVADYELVCQSQSELDIPFWREFIKRYEPTHVLELACGSGRIGIELLRGSQTFHLEGLDINEDMLAAYREKLEHAPDAIKRRVSLHYGDMCHYDLENKGQFDLIFLPFNSLGHLYETRQQLDAFRTTYEHLAPGGRFVVDIYLPRNISGDSSPQFYLDDVIETADGTYTLVVYSTHQYNRYEQIDHMTYIHEKFFASGTNERHLIRLDSRAFFPGELQMLFQVAGFEVEGIYGGYAWQPFERGTRQIVIGRKPDS